MESSTLGRFMRESWAWTYALVNLAHILGIAALFGAVLILDLRLLGAWRRTPLHAVTSVAGPLAAAGFSVAVATGVCLLAANATEYAGNPFFNVKFPAIALGFMNAVALRRTRAWREHGRRALSGSESRKLAVMAAVSLGSWLTAITAGRLIGYW
jgi:hypothetical protein